jgi:hypothetical protein
MKASIATTGSGRRLLHLFISEKDHAYIGSPQRVHMMFVGREFVICAHDAGAEAVWSSKTRCFVASCAIEAADVMPHSRDGLYTLAQRRAAYRGERALVARLPGEWIFEIRRGGQRKIDDMDLMGIRRRIASGERLQDLAAKYQVNKTTIRSIIRSKRKVLENQPVSRSIAAEQDRRRLSIVRVLSTTLAGAPRPRRTQGSPARSRATSSACGATAK